MCDPLTIAGVALSAGSVVANSMAQSKVQKARDDALAAERIRQQGYQQEAKAMNAQSRDRYNDFSGQQAEKSQELGDYFKSQTVAQNTANEAATKEMSNSTMPATRSNLVVSEEAKQKQQASDYTNAQGEALGNLRAFGDLMGDIGRKQARDASQIGQIGNFMKGSSSVLPYELEAANSKGSGWGLAGSLLGLGGNVVTSAGITGAFNTPAGTTRSGTGIVPTNTATAGWYNPYGRY